jgi:parvulin-like peptidyl-prolyl isomerase
MVRTEVLAANGRARGYLDTYDVRRDLQHVLAGRYEQETIEPQLAVLGVTDHEVAAFYQEHPERFTVPAAARAAIIFLAVRHQAPDAVVAEVRARAAAVRAEAERQQGETLFGALAANHSDDQASRYQGGDTGWIAAGQPDSRFEPAVIDAIFALDRAGQLAPLVETPEGLYVIRLVEKRPAALRPLASVAAEIRAQLLAEKRHRRRTALYAEAAGRVPVDVHAERLPTPPAATPAARRAGPPPLPDR